MPIYMYIIRMITTGHMYLVLLVYCVFFNATSYPWKAFNVLLIKMYASPEKRRKLHIH